jgi:hypothetical protein
VDFDKSGRPNLRESPFQQSRCDVGRETCHKHLPQWWLAHGEFVIFSSSTHHYSRKLAFLGVHFFGKTLILLFEGMSRRSLSDDVIDKEYTIICENIQSFTMGGF